MRALTILAISLLASAVLSLTSACGDGGEGSDVDIDAASGGGGWGPDASASCLGCDANQSFEGDYRLTQVLEDEAGCTDPTAERTIDSEDEYVRLTLETLPRESGFLDVLGWHQCTGPGACDEGFSILESFENHDGVWSMETTMAFWAMGDCTYAVDRSIIERVDASTLRVTMRHGEEATPENMDTCLADGSAESRAPTLPCTSISTKTMTLL